MRYLNICKKYSDIKKIFHTIILYYVFFSSSFVFLTPFNEAPDEIFHLQFINYVSKYKTLPDQYEGLRNNEKFVGQGHQYPLYYIFTGIVNYFFNPDKQIVTDITPNKLHLWNGGTSGKVPVYNHLAKDEIPDSKDKFLFYLFRFLSVVFGTVNIIFVFKISKLVFGDNVWTLLPPLFVATLPQFLFISGAVNNDCLANMFSTICIYYIFKIVKNNANFKNCIILGIFMGLGILAKKTLLFFAPGIIIVFIYLIFKNRYDRKILLYAAVTILTCSAICGWYFIRNYSTYGELFGSRMEYETMFPLVFRRSLFSDYFITEFPKGIYHSFIASFGWMNLKLPIVSYVIYTLIICFSLFGITVYFKKSKSNLDLILVSFLFFITCLAGIVYFNLTFTQYQGRYLFPVLSVIALIFSLGISEFTLIMRYGLFKKLLVAFLIVYFIFIDILSLYTSYCFYYNPAQYL